MAAHQLYSQITWRFYDIYFGIVMVFDATNGNKGPDAGHVHCMLSWSPDASTWHWVDRGGLEGLREFIPTGEPGSFESHVCFAAHSPLRMPDGSSRVYYMGGNGPHSGARNSSFALATLRPDRFAGLASAASTGSESSSGGTMAAATSSSGRSKAIKVSGKTMTITLDVHTPGSGAVTVTVSVMGFGSGNGEALVSSPIKMTGTDTAVVFPGSGLVPLVGKEVQLTLAVVGATVYTVGFSN